MNTDQYITRQQAAEILHISAKTFSNYRSAGKYGLHKIPVYPGRRYKREDILNILENAGVTA